MDGRIFWRFWKTRLKSGRYSFMSFILLSVHWRICFKVTHNLYILPPVLAEQVGVCAGVKHQKFQFVALLLPNQQPVGLDMTLPLALSVTVEHVWAIDFGQSSVAFEQLDDGAEFIHRIATLDTTLQVLLELVGGGNLVSHQMPIFLKNSSLFS